MRAPVWLKHYLEGLPPISGNPISLKFQPVLTAHRGKLLSGIAETGTPVHAASFLRERRIVLDEALCDSDSRLQLILTHEIAHFLWWRLGNRRRREFTALLVRERIHCARGELGESAEVAKESLKRSQESLNTQRGKYYVCESFCDTAAWMYARVPRHESYQLADRWRRLRRVWFLSLEGLSA